MTRPIRNAHYEQFKDKPVEKRIAYYRERARLLDEEIGKQARLERKPAE